MKRFTRISFLISAIVILALFARTAAFSYIGLDDAAYTFRNPFVAGGLSLANVVEAFANFRHGGIWMPVAYISYMIDASLCRMIGVPVIGWMHLANVFLHVINFFLLWKMLTVLFERQQPTVCLFAAAIWAVHPLRAEPVAWIAARKELLWTLFTLVGLICWAKAVSHRHNINPQSSIRYQLTSLLCCALACLAKPTAMCFPLLAWLVEMHARCGAEEKPQEHRRMFFYLPMLLMAGVTAAVAAYSQTHVAGQEATTLYGVPFLNRCVNALSALGFYIRAAVFPVGLHFDCRTVTDLLPLDGIWNICAAAVFLVLFVSGRKFLSLGWFVLSLIPTLGIFGSFGIEAHADRFAYLPSMAMSFVLLPCLSRPVVNWFACAALIMLSALTFRQVGFWRDDAAAYSRTLSCDPEHPRAMVHVADALCSRRHDFNGGISLYRKALSLADTVPQGGFDTADVKARLAYALVSRGGREDFAEVKRLGSDVLRNMSLDRRGMMLDALGSAFMREGDIHLAGRLFKASLNAPARFWPKSSTQRKLDACRER